MLLTGRNRVIAGAGYFNSVIGGAGYFNSVIGGAGYFNSVIADARGRLNGRGHTRTAI